jgi:FkbM family methyltransferase
MSSKIWLLVRNYIKVISNSKATMPLLAYILLIPLKHISLQLGSSHMASFARRLLLWSPVVKIRDGGVSLLVRLLTRESLLSRDDWEWKHLEGIIEEGDVALDIGANIGVFADKIARRIGARGRVIAVEPNPASFRLLATNLRLNDCTNAIPLNVAVADKIGRFSLIASSLEPQSTRLLPAESDLGGNSPRELIGIDAVTVDSLVSTFLKDRRVNVCKIDTEGMEFIVLKGATEFLKTPDLKLWIEVHEPPVSPKEIKKFLEKTVLEQLLCVLLVNHQLAPLKR